jgi:hypothetical protein
MVTQGCDVRFIHEFDLRRADSAQLRAAIALLTGSNLIERKRPYVFRGVV